jgi:hypothetical protein
MIAKAREAAIQLEQLFEADEREQRAAGNAAQPPTS